MSARVAGRVHRAQVDGRVAFEFDAFAVLDETVYADFSFQSLSGQTVRGDVQPELFAQSFDAADVVWGVVRQDSLARPSALRLKLFDELAQPLLLVLVGRAGIDDDEVACADDGAVGRRRGRPGRRAGGGPEDGGDEANAADR